MLFALLLASAVAAAPAAPVGRPWLDARALIARRAPAPVVDYDGGRRRG